MPQIGVGIERHGREKDDDRLAQRVGGLDRDIERGIVEGALGALHPVNDAGAVGIGSALAAHADTRIFEKLFKTVHRFNSHPFEADSILLGTDS